MRELNLRCIDLNLLVALNALLEEKHVTNAALKLNMTQSSMSRALGRIRETFGDQILVRMPDGYEITPHAENLVDPVKRILNDVQRIMVAPEFDPSQTNDEFVISALDYAEILVGSCFMQRVNKKAPNSKITIVGRNPNTIKELINGSIDITLGAAPRQIPENCHSSLILNGKLVCVVDKNHPLANETITLEKYLAYPHAILHSGFAKLPVDEALAKLGHKRVVAKESPNFVASVMSLRKTSMILSLPEIAVTSLLDVSGLVMHDLPFDVPPLKISMIWHKRNETNPSHRWFRQELMSVMLNAGDPRN